MLAVSLEALQGIRAHAAAAYPEECVGALLGEVEGARKTALDAHPLPNDRSSDRERRYVAGPDAMRGAERAARRRGLEIVGIYHSHPDHPARPSALDREHAWPWYSYVIVSVERGEPRSVTSWVLTEDRVRFDEEVVTWL
jgi:proteasome lid subunit RPN8/RPN11